MTTEDFLRAIWPSTGWYCLAVKKEKGFKHVWFSDISKAAKAVSLLSLAGHEVFHACCTYQSDTKRTQANAKEAKALWMDIDVGEGKPYATLHDAVRAVRDFLLATSLPRPLIISSGGGLHVYFLFDAPIAAQDVKNYGEALKALAVRSSLHIDTTRTGDPASILRPVGSINRKYDPIRVVEALLQNPNSFCKPGDFKDRRTVEGIGAAPAELEKPAGVGGLRKGIQKDVPGLNDEFLAERDWPEADANKVIQGCRQIKEGALAAEPIWYAGIGVLTFCKEPKEIIHAWSSPYEGYSVAETDAKIAQAEKFGPTTCATFDARNPGGCTGCPHRNAITSPIQLGNIPEEFTQRPPSIYGEGADDADDAVVTADTPFGFSFRQHGLWYQTKDVEATNVYNYPLFVTDLAWDDDEKREMVFLQHRLPLEGWKYFALPAADLGDIKAFGKSIRNNHVKPLNTTLLLKYVEGSARSLQSKKKIRTLYSSMGWKDGTDRFVLGHKVFVRDGSVEAAGISHRAGESVKGFKSKGEIEPWIAQTALFSTVGMEAHAFTFLAAFGSPLMVFTGLQAAFFSVVGPTGSGKSTVANLLLSTFGDHKKLFVRKIDTDTVKDTRMGAFSALPVYIDEVTNMEPKALSDFIYSLTQGRSKGRGRIDGSERPTADWNNIVVSSSNSSLAGRLGTGKSNSKAERVRLFEYRLEAVPHLNRKTSQQLHDVIADNYGVAGERYIQYIVTHQDEVKAGVRKAMLAIDKLTGAPDEERFWTGGVASTLYGGMLARKLGLILFDPMPLWVWAVNTIKAARYERLVDATDDIEVLGRYLNEFAQERITVDETKEGFDSEKKVNYPPRGELHQRFEVNSGLLYVEKHHFRTWLSDNHEDWSEIRTKLQEKRIYLSSVRKSLGAGTGFPTANVECLKFDLNVPEVGMTKMRLVEALEQTKPVRASGE